MKFLVFILVILPILFTVNANDLDNSTCTTSPTKSSCLCQNGRDGRDGRDGLTLTGPAGRDGKDGQEGRDCVECARGPKGEQGPAGHSGKDGVRGKDGLSGKKGDKGDKGDKGNPGTSGASGAKGGKGDKGDKGVCDSSKLKVIDQYITELSTAVKQLNKDLAVGKKDLATAKKIIGEANAQIGSLKREVALLKKNTVKLDSNNKIKQSLLPGGYSNFTASDLQWQSLHMAAAAACRATSGTGGSGDLPNMIFSRDRGMTCNAVCNGTSIYKECDSELTLMGNIVKAESYKTELGSFYNYGCDNIDTVPSPGFEASSPHDKVITSPQFMSYCCCRKPDPDY